MSLSTVLPRNHHPVERALRILVGLIVLALVFVGPRSPWALLGLVPLATGLAGSCPLYSLFGVSTGRARAPKAAPTRA